MPGLKCGVRYQWRRCKIHGALPHTHESKQKAQQQPIYDKHPCAHPHANVYGTSSMVGTVEKIDSLQWNFFYDRIPTSSKPTYTMLTNVMCDWFQNLLLIELDITIIDASLCP